MARMIAINPVTPQERLLWMVVDVLKNDGVIAYPTDTSYGIGCDIHSTRAIERIYRMKGKERTATLSFICSDLSHLADYAVVTNAGFRLMKGLLPGPYTFVLKSTKLPPRILQTRQKSVGIRVPDHPIPLKLIELLGGPIVNTTANVSGGPPFSHPWEIDEALGHAIDLIIDGGAIPGTVSTVIAIEDDGFRVLREGKGMERL